MKVNAKILHIPPYISTSWNFVRALYLKGSNLVISLAAGVDIDIPNLKPDILEIIFEAHSCFLEENQSPSTAPDANSSPLQMSLVKRTPLMTEARRLPEGESDSSLIFGVGAFDSLGSVLHHNASQSNIPDLPHEVLKKISAIAKIVSPEDAQALPKAEPHCNCTHCQIARAVHKGLDDGLENSTPTTQIPRETAEDEVTDAELSFQQWEITQTGEQLFTCSNRLDSMEIYNVYLGNPVGCTCGKTGCEHIHAVLKS